MTSLIKYGITTTVHSRRLLHLNEESSHLNEESSRKVRVDDHSTLTFFVQRTWLKRAYQPLSSSPRGIQLALAGPYQAALAQGQRQASQGQSSPSHPRWIARHRLVCIQHVHDASVACPP